MLDYDPRKTLRFKRSVQRFEDLVIWELTFQEGDYWCDEYPHDFDVGAGVDKGPWRTKPYVFFVREGAFEMQTSLGPKYRVAPPNPPRWWHPGGQFVLKALEPNSTIVCISDKNKAKPTMWQRERRQQGPGETLTLPANADWQYLYLCSGELILPYGVMTETNRFYQVPRNREMLIETTTGADYVYLHSPAPFVPEFSDEAPDYVAPYMIDEETA